MTNPNDCAFPFDRNKIIVGGLTKREYFAAMALQGILADNRNNDNEKNYAIVAIRLADALIEQLNKQPEDGKETIKR